MIILQATSLSTERVNLRPVLPQDLDFLYQIAVAPENALKWRFRGTTPNFEQFRQQLGVGVHAQFLVEIDVQSPRPAGLVVVYNADLLSRTAYMAALAAPGLHGSGLVFEGLVLLLNYCFSIWDFRKMYAETNDESEPLFAQVIAREILVEEARLVNHDFYNGGYHDRCTYALYQDAFYKAFRALTR